MPKIKAKVKDNQLLLDVKLIGNEVLNVDAFNFFARKSIRGLLVPKSNTGNKKLQYVGPVAFSLAQRLSQPMSKFDFFYLVEQVVDLVPKMMQAKLDCNRVYFDMNYIFINGQTKEVQFLYLPLLQPEQNINYFTLLYNIISRVVPMPEPDNSYTTRFMTFLRSLKYFDVDTIEQYIAKEDSKVINIVKKHNVVGESGYMTDKPQDYYDHYEQKMAGNVYNPGSMPNPAAPQPNQYVPGQDMQMGAAPQNLMGGQPVVNAQYEEPVANVQPAAEPQPSMDVPNMMYGTAMAEQPAQDIPVAQAPGYMPQPEQYVPQQNPYMPQQNQYVPQPEQYVPQQNQFAPQQNNFFNAAPVFEEDATSLLVEEDATSLLVEEDEMATTLLVDEPVVHYASLERVSNGEKMDITKTSFRIGKDRNTADFWVSENNAVSRSHADIITKGRRYYVVDLNSTNKTYINNLVIMPQQETEIFDGDMLKLANEDFIFHI